eukprot:16191-Heterococcus_DN1.PRE.1
MSAAAAVAPLIASSLHAPMNSTMWRHTTAGSPDVPLAGTVGVVSTAAAAGVRVASAAGDACLAR